MNDYETVDWRKSSYSSQGSSNCVEVAGLATAIGVRDSKDRSGPVLTFSASAWQSFGEAVKAGRFDL
jgi:hypothetical protein